MVVKDQAKDRASPYHRKDETAGLKSFPDKSRSSQTTDDEKNLVLLQQYFSCIDGTHSSWDNVSLLCPKVIHKDLRFVVSYGTDLDYDEFQETLKAHCLSGNISNLESWEENSDGTLTALICNVLPNGQTQRSKQTHWYKEGKIVRVEIDPKDSEKVEDLVEQLRGRQT